MEKQNKWNLLFKISNLFLYYYKRACVGLALHRWKKFR